MGGYKMRGYTIQIIVMVRGSTKCVCSCKSQAGGAGFVYVHEAL